MSGAVFQVRTSDTTKLRRMLKTVFGQYVVDPKTEGNKITFQVLNPSTRLNVRTWLCDLPIVDSVVDS